MKNLKVLVLWVFVVLGYSQSHAEIRKVQMLEGEARMGISSPVGGYHGGKGEISMSLGLEGRYNLSHSPWDCGLILELSTANRSFENLFHDGYKHLQNNRTLGFTAIVDYNLKQGSMFNPYAGLGLGIANCDVVGGRYFKSSGSAALLAPRIGVELLYHIRISAQLNLTRSGYNNVCINLGLVLGGRPKK